MAQDDGGFTQGDLLDLIPRLRWKIEDGSDRAFAVDRLMGAHPRARTAKPDPLAWLRASDGWHQTR